MSALYIYTEVLDVFDMEDESKKRGTIFITEEKIDNSFTFLWKWEHGPNGHDNGDFDWRQQFLILNSFMTSPKSEVWAVVNRSWQKGSVVPKPKPWFAETDKIIVTNEDAPPYPTYRARRRK